MGVVQESDLPPEALVEIFSKLHVEEAFECRRICRRWNGVFARFGAAAIFKIDAVTVTVEELVEGRVQADGDDHQDGTAGQLLVLRCRNRKTT